MGFTVRVTIAEADAQADGSLAGVCVLHPDMRLKHLLVEIARADCIEVRVTDREPNEVYTCFQRDLSQWRSRGLGFRTLELFAASAEAFECTSLVKEIKARATD